MKELLSHGNLETRSRDYVTIDEAVFSPCQAELCRVVTSRASARCQATAINTWKMQEWGWVTRPPRVPKWRHVFPQWCNNRRALFSRVSDQRFIGETEARLQVVLEEFSVADTCGRFMVGEDLIVWIEDLVWAVFSWVTDQFSSRRGAMNAVTVVVQLGVNNSRGRSTWIRVRIGTRSTEGNKRSVCEELTCD
jgi:hypothetical protein